MRDQGGHTLMALALAIQLIVKINGLARDRSQGKAWGVETPEE